MGVDLRLLPFDADQGNWAYSHTILNCSRDYDLHDRIRNLKSMPVPPSFTSFSGRSKDFDDTCYGETQETPYGEQVEYVLAGDLVNVKHRKDDDRARAARAYLRELPPHTKVALYWY